jgi:hypothetical protein
MSQSLEMVDRLARLAADAEPPALDERASRSMIERALAQSRRAPANALPWRAMLAVGALAVVAGLLVVRAGASHEAELVHIALPTGDRLVGTESARFEIAELAPTSRRFRLQRGAMLFDVARVAPAQRFEVATADIVVVATGTVFSVALRDSIPHVEVFEGRVEVHHAGRTHAVTAGAHWSPDGERAPTLLAEAASEAVTARRDASSAPVALIEPPVAAPPVAHAQIDPPVAVAPAPTDPSAAPPVVQTHVEPPVVAPPGAAPTNDDPVATKPRPPVRDRAITVEKSKPPEVPAVPLDQLLAHARADVAAGRFADALATIDAAENRGASTADWALARADALRGLGRTIEAAQAFETAAASLHGSSKITAAYSAAYLRFQDGDSSRALDALDAHGVDAEGSPLEERGLGLRAQALVKAKRDARPTALRYLARFPHGGLRAYMQRLAR